MTDNSKKIEWYKEVLELEPNSKVFFPLARMLAEEGCVDEAIKILQSGIVRHEEFLEARLFLIELLYKNGMREPCDHEVEKLNAMFSEYAGFWQAWAACLSTVRGEHDAASALNFIAAHFICGKISLHEVIDKGLAAILHTPAVPSVADVTADICTDDVAPATSQDHDIDRLSADNNSATTPVDVDISDADSDAGLNESYTPESAAVQAAAPDKSFNAPEAILIEDYNEEPAVREPGESSAHNGFKSCSDEQVKDDLPAVATENDAESGVGDEIVDAEVVLDTQEPHAVSENEIVEDGEEHFSLRTRSMAEVLAEQGDFNGALDIYHELHAAAISLEEKEDLEKCISLLESKIIAAQELDLTSAAQEYDEPGSGQDKLITMLEALAERVEARAQE